MCELLLTSGDALIKSRVSKRWFEKGHRARGQNQTQLAIAASRSAHASHTCLPAVRLLHSRAPRRQRSRPERSACAPSHRSQRRVERKLKMQKGAHTRPNCGYAGYSLQYTGKHETPGRQVDTNGRGIGRWKLGRFASVEQAQVTQLLCGSATDRLQIDQCTSSESACRVLSSTAPLPLAL